MASLRRQQGVTTGVLEMEDADDGVTEAQQKQEELNRLLPCVHLLWPHLAANLSCPWPAVCHASCASLSDLHPLSMLTRCHNCVGQWTCGLWASAVHCEMDLL